MAGGKCERCMQWWHCRPSPWPLGTWCAPLRNPTGVLNTKYKSTHRPLPSLIQGGSPHVHFGRSCSWCHRRKNLKAWYSILCNEISECWPPCRTLPWLYVNSAAIQWQHGRFQCHTPPRKPHGHVCQNTMCSDALQIPGQYRTTTSPEKLGDSPQIDCKED